MPFQPDEEAQLVQLLREKRVWPCFVGTKHRIGERGCQIIGYWQRKTLEAQGHIVPRKTTSKTKKRTASQWLDLEVDVAKTYNTSQTSAWSFAEGNYSQEIDLLDELVGTPPVKKTKQEYTEQKVPVPEASYYATAAEESFWNFLVEELQTNELDPLPGWSW